MRSRLVKMTILMVFVLAACGGSDDTESSNGEASAVQEEPAGSSPTGADSSIDAGAFYLEYDKDPDGTEAKYLGEVLTLNGTVSTFGTNEEVVAYVNLLVSRIQCIFAEPGPQPEFAAITAGLTKTVRGTVEFRTETVRKEEGRFALFRPPGKILTLVDCDVIE